MELLQHELDLAKAALLNLSPAPVPNEVARRPTGFDGVVQPTGAAGCGTAAEASQAAPPVIEAAEDVVARAQALLSPPTTNHPPRTTHHPPPTTRRPPRTIHHRPPIAHPPTTHRLSLLQAMMEEAMTAAQEITTKASVATPSLPLL